MRILFIQPNPIFGGAATATISIAKLLMMRGVEVIYSDEYDGLDKRNGITVDHYPYHKNRFKFHSTIRRHIETINPDVICWSSYILPYYLFDINKLRRNGIYHLSILHSLALKRDLKGSVLEFLSAHSLPMLDAMVFVSNYTLESWNKYNAINTFKGIKRVLYNAVEITDELTIVKQPCSIGFVGRFSDEKQPEVFCALSNYYSLKEYEFHAFGDGPLRESCMIKYPRVNYHGRINDANEIYKNIDILVLTSRFENCPMVILEAKTRGIPCVAPRVGGIPEIVSDGKTGVLFDLYNVESVALAICKVIGSYAELSGACKKDANNYSFENAGIEWNNLLDMLKK